MVIYIHLNDVERVFFAFVSQVLVFRTETVKASNKNYFSKINNSVVYKKKDAQHYQKRITIYRVGAV